MLTRRSLIQGVLSLAALAPLGRAAVAEGRIAREEHGRFIDQMRPADFEPLYRFGDGGVWKISPGDSRRLTSGETVELAGQTWTVTP